MQAFSDVFQSTSEMYPCSKTSVGHYTLVIGICAANLVD
jgi:hypothetical protein